MATYREIQDWVKAKHDFVPKSCWIAHCKELKELPVRVSSRRYNVNKRVVRCDDMEKRKAIFEAFEYFGMTKNKKPLL